MALQLATQLGAGCMAQVYSNALTSSAGAAYESLIDGTDITSGMALAAVGVSNQQVPVLLEFESHTDTHQTVVDGLGSADVQVFSEDIFQVLHAADALGDFDTTFREANNLISAQAQPLGAKLSSSASGVQDGSVLRTSSTSRAGQATAVDSIVVELTSGATTAPVLADVVNHYQSSCPQPFFAGNRCNGIAAAVNTALGLTLASLSPTATATLVSASTNRAVYTFDSVIDANEFFLYMVLLANEPSVLFVEPAVAAEVMATVRSTNGENGGAALGVVQGHAGNVAEGFSSNGQCNYLTDRFVDGSGSTVAVIDNGIDALSTFFYAPDESTPCLSGTSGDCCAFTNGCASLTCSASCTAVTDSAGLGGVAVAVATDARKLLSIVPVVDAASADHGTLVTSAIVGNPYSGRDAQCAEGTEADVEGVQGVAPGAQAIFIDVGLDGDDQYLDLPVGSFGSVLQELAYDQGANNVVLAFGAETGGASNAVTRDIDNFVASNADAVVVAATGSRTSTNGNGDTSLAKNGLSVGVFSRGSMPSVSPDLSVQFSERFFAGSAGAGTTENFCASEEFYGSSAATAVVGGQVALAENFIRSQDVPIFHYDAARAQTITSGQTDSGSTIKALLVAAANNAGFGSDYGNGFGVATLENVLPFEEEHQTDLRIEQHTFSGSGDSISREITVVDTTKPLVVALAYADAAPTAFAASSNYSVVNDVRLTVTTPSSDFAPAGVVVYANGATDNSNPASTLQKVIIDVPEEGTYTVTVSANFVSTTSIASQTASVVVSGRFSVPSSSSPTTVTGQDAGEYTTVPACCPYGTILPTTSCFPISFIVLIVLGVLIVGLLVICIVRAKLRVKADPQHDES